MKKSIGPYLIEVKKKKKKKKNPLKRDRDKKELWDTDDVEEFKNEKNDYDEEEYYDSQIPVTDIMYQNKKTQPGFGGKGRGPQNQTDVLEVHMNPLLAKDYLEFYKEHLLKGAFQANARVGLPENPKVLGSGSYGAAFDIGNGKILKITHDESEAKASSVIVGKKLKGVWQVHGVYKYKHMMDRYVIIGEKLKEMPEADWVKIKGEINAAIFQAEKDSPIHRFNFAWSISSEYNAAAMKEFKPLVGKKTYQLLQGMFSLKKAGIDFRDLHGGNVMMRGDEPVIIDLGMSKSRKGKIEMFENRQEIGDFYNVLLESSLQKISGLKLPPEPKVLGEGTYGVAYDIGGGKVLKVTTDKTEGKASSLLVGKDIEGVWNIYGVYRYKKLKDRYVIIGEKLKQKDPRPIITQLINAFIVLQEEGIVSKSYDYFGTDAYKDKKIIHDIEEVLLETDGKYIDEVLYLARGMHNLVNAGVKWEDLHSGNVLFRGKMPVIVDLGMSRSAAGKIQVFEATCPIHGEYYGGLPTTGGFGSYTEYEIGAGTIAESTHCILGSISRMYGDRTNRGEIEHIKEEMGIIEKTVKEYAKEIAPYMLDQEKVRERYYGNEAEQRIEYMDKSVESIKKASPALIQKAKIMQKKMDKSADPLLVELADLSYDVTIKLAEAMLSSTKTYPKSFKSAFKDTKLISSIRKLSSVVGKLS